MSKNMLFLLQCNAFVTDVNLSHFVAKYGLKINDGFENAHLIAERKRLKTGFVTKREDGDKKSSTYVTSFKDYPKHYLKKRSKEVTFDVKNNE
jgi:hypothetical protein